MSQTSPQLVARLQTNESGEPVFVERDGLKHFNIVFEIRNAPKDAYAATFKLDPDTYYNPTRTLRPSPEGRFELETTTYGDYPVSVSLRTKEGEIAVNTSVKEALIRTRPTANGGSSLDEALDYISSH